MSVYTSICSNLLFPLHETLKGHGSVALRRELETTQWLPPDEIARMQLLRLRGFLSYISEKVPYYRRCIGTAGIDPSAIQSLRDIAGLPMLTKAIIRDNFTALRTEERTTVRRYSTGGSSGEPLQFLIGRGRIDHDVAAKWRATRWWGVDIGDREIVLWGSPIELGAQDRLRGLRDRILRTRLLPAFKMSDASMDLHLEAIRKYRPRMLFGYASALDLLAEHANGRGQILGDLGVKAIFATGETLYDAQRARISSTFGAPVGNGYGSRDAGFIAHECPSGSLHISAEHVIVETLDESGRAAGPDMPGEIVVTHLGTRDFPFLRYRTGDIGVLASRPCECGRGLPVLSHVHGRSTDFVLTPSGNRLHGLALIYEIRERTGVRAFKFLQSEDLSIELRLVADPAFDKSEEDDVLRRLHSRLGPGARIAISRVDGIPPESSGKYRYVESRARRSAT